MPMHSHAPASALRREIARAPRLGVALGIALLIAACVDSPVAPVPPDAAPMLERSATAVIVPAFDSVALRSARLSQALDALANDATVARVAAAQGAWRSAREAWELTEAFAFGPASTGGYDQAMDTWPLDLAGLDAWLRGASPVTAAAVAALDPTLVGFHGLEAVLWGAGAGSAAAGRDPAAVAGALTARQRDYLREAGRLLARQAQGLADAWAPARGGYALEFSGPGSAASRYGTQRAAMQDLIGGVLDPAEEVATSKIARPLETNDSAYEESRFSDNTLADLRANVASSLALYLGVDAHVVLALAPGALSAGDAMGVRAYVLQTQPSVDARVLADYAAARRALDALAPSFGTSLAARREDVLAAQRAVLRLHATLLARLVPVVGAVGDE